MFEADDAGRRDCRKERPSNGGMGVAQRLQTALFSQNLRDVALTTGFSVLVFLLGFGWDLDRLRYPLGAGDALYAYATVDTWGHGDIFGNTTYGFPFGWDQRYFPTTDVIQNAVGALIVFATDNPFLGLNAVFALSFPLTALASLWVFRLAGVRGPVAIVASLAITTIPFHWLRVEHPYLATMYPAVLGVGLALITAVGGVESAKSVPWWRSKRYQSAIAATIVALSGIYFAFFSVLLCAVAFVYRLCHVQLTSRTLLSAAPAGVVATITGMALSPAILHQRANPSISPIAERMPFESVSYSGNLLFAMLPAPITRVPGLREAVEPLESAMAAATSTGVGVHLLSNFGSLFSTLAVVVCLIGWVASSKSRVAVPASWRGAEPSLALIGLLVAVAALFFVPFGLNLAFAGTISPQIRGWDRLVVVLLVLVITGAVVSWRDLGWPSSGARVWVGVAGALAILAVDAVAPHRTYFDEATFSGRIEYDHAIVYTDALNSLVPGGCGVLQLPYQDFPEAAGLNNLPTYQALLPSLTDPTKSWSYGAMKNTRASQWARQLGDDLTPEVIDQLRRAGFCAVHVDRRGYTDQTWAPLTDRLTQLLGPPILTGHNGDWWAYRLPVTGASARVDVRDPSDIERETLSFYYPPVVSPSPGTSASEERDASHRWWWLTGSFGRFDVRTIEPRVRFQRIHGAVQAAPCNDQRIVIRFTSEEGTRTTGLHLPEGGRRQFELTLPSPATMARLTLRTEEPCASEDGRRLSVALLDPVID